MTISGGKQLEMQISNFQNQITFVEDIFARFCLSARELFLQELQLFFQPFILCVVVVEENAMQRCLWD
jgi:hypothetical protein